MRASAPGRRALDFIQLEQATLKLLTVEDPSELLLRLELSAWTHLLVDEFQDTSQNQLDLLCRLMAGWEQAAGRTLMVVGDPKQSIYGWRQAKPRLFLESRSGLPCPEAAAIPLHAPFAHRQLPGHPDPHRVGPTRSLETRCWASPRSRRRDRVSRPQTTAPKPPAGAQPATGPGPQRQGMILPPGKNEARWLARQVAEALPRL